jgi:hypothetical protein
MTETIRLSDFPDDVQVLVQDIVSAADDSDTVERLWRHEFVVRRRKLTNFPRRIRFCDYRGTDYALSMVGQSLPPVVVCGQSLLDGYHRVWAARHQDRKWIAAIDLEEIGCCIASPVR